MRANLKFPIAKTAVRSNSMIYAEPSVTHGDIRHIHSLKTNECDCGFLNTNGDWLERKEAFIVAMYHDQLTRDAYKFLARRLLLGYDLTESHPGLDSMWLTDWKKA